MYGICFDEDRRLVCFMELAKVIQLMSTEDTIGSYSSDIKWAIHKWGLSEEFEALKDPLKVENKKTKLELLIDERRSAKRKRDGQENGSKKRRLEE